MARAQWSSTADLEESLVARDLYADPKDFSFFEAIRILARLAPDRPEPGAGTEYERDLVHFRAWPSMLRSPSDLRAIERIETPYDPVEHRLEIAFMGLYGLSSPTPSYFWEYVARNPDSALRDFLDIFNSRAIGLFYQAWKRYRWHLLYRGRLDPMSRRFVCFLGLGSETEPSATRLEDDRLDRPNPQLVDHSLLDRLGDRNILLAYAGLLSQRTRPAVNLKNLLWEFFDGPRNGREPFVDIEENVRQWAYLGAEDHSRLGQRNSMLGGAGYIVAGTRVPDRMGAFRVHIGPLSLSRFLMFLPDGESFGQLAVLVGLASPMGTEFDVDLRLKPEEAPPCALGSDQGSRLGWTSFVASTPYRVAPCVRLRAAFGSKARTQSSGLEPPLGKERLN